MPAYPGIDPISAPPAAPGFGTWVTVNVLADGEQRAAEPIAVGLEGLVNRDNWLAQRTIDWIGSGVFTIPTGVALEVEVLHVTDQVLGIGLLVDEGTRTRALAVDEDATIGGELDVTGDATFNDDVEVIDDLTVGGTLIYDTANDLGTLSSGAVITRTDKTTYSGTGAYVVDRSWTTGPDADVGSFDALLRPGTFCPTLTADRTWTLDTPSISGSYEHTITRAANSSSFKLDVDMGLLGTFTFAAGTYYASATFVWSGAWNLKSWSVNSGSASQTFSVS